MVTDWDISSAKIIIKHFDKQIVISNNLFMFVINNKYKNGNKVKTTKTDSTITVVNNCIN